MKSRNKQFESTQILVVFVVLQQRVTL